MEVIASRVQISGKLDNFASVSVWSLIANNVDWHTVRCTCDVGCVYLGKDKCCHSCRTVVLLHGGLQSCIGAKRNF